jgi:hypothetical protein
MATRTEVKVTLRRTRPTIGIHVVNEEPTIGMKVVSGEMAPTYHGQYEVTPSAVNDITLETAGMKMSNDVTVFKIPYWETSNPQGGFTVYIGNDTEIMQ